MSDSMNMFINYESRKVGRYEDKNGLMINTCAVTDSNTPYETAVSHPFYNNGDLIIVDTYSTKDDALRGHARWVSIMTAPELPKNLTDVGVCQIKLALGIPNNLSKERNLIRRNNGRTKEK